MYVFVLKPLSSTCVLYSLSCVIDCIDNMIAVEAINAAIEEIGDESDAEVAAVTEMESESEQEEADDDEDRNLTRSLLEVPQYFPYQNVSKVFGTKQYCCSILTLIFLAIHVGYPRQPGRI